MSIQRREAGGVLSFTFLDVLTCTMGSLVLLVVVLGEKAADTSLEDALRNPRKSAAAKQTADPPIENDGQASQPVAKAPSKIADTSELERQEAKLHELRKKAERRLAEEKARLAHLEEHERRLEHELAKLHTALQLLAASEQDQIVDQQTAERELQRLQQLIEDTENQIKSLTMDGGKKTYAIVPYKGKFGTFRRPIYIECVDDKIIIQPEGVTFPLHEAREWIRTGNPLASAIRAAHEELNSRARSAGEKEMPDAYPLFIVRPSGVLAYELARSAIASWDVEFGEEYIEAEWKLHYMNPDPELERIMLHAVNQAKIRQAQLARIAPRMYGVGGGPTRGTGSPSLQSRSGERQAAAVSGSEGGRQQQWLAAPTTAGKGSPSGRPHRRYGETRRGKGNFIDEFETPEASAASPITTAGNEEPAGVPDGPLASGAATPSPTEVPQAESIEPQQARTGAEFTALSQPVAEGTQQIRVETPSAPSNEAGKRESNWANRAASRGAPITRPIAVVVRPDHLAIAPAGDSQTTPQGSVITFRQTHDEVLNELAAAVRQRIDDWGYAGRGMYWRPTLALQVAPDSKRQAERLQELLADSGLDVRLDYVASLPEVEAPHVRK